MESIGEGLGLEESAGIPALGTSTKLEDDIIGISNKDTKSLDSNEECVKSEISLDKTKLRKESITSSEVVTEWKRNTSS